MKTLSLLASRSGEQVGIHVLTAVGQIRPGQAATQRQARSGIMISMDYRLGNMDLGSVAQHLVLSIPADDLMMADVIIKIEVMRFLFCLYI